MHARQDGDVDVHVIVHFDSGLCSCWTEHSPYVLHDAALERKRERQEEGVEFRKVESLAEETSRCQQERVPRQQPVLPFRSTLLARAFLPIPPRITTDRMPSFSSSREILSRCSVHCVSIRQFRPALTARTTSSQICRDRSSSSTMALNTSWIATSSTSRESWFVAWVTKTRSIVRWSASAELIRCRSGPQYIVMSFSRWSLR